MRTYVSSHRVWYSETFSRFYAKKVDFSPFLTLQNHLSVHLLNGLMNMLPSGRSCPRRTFSRTRRCAHLRGSNSYATCLFSRIYSKNDRFFGFSQYSNDSSEVNSDRDGPNLVSLAPPRSVDMIQAKSRPIRQSRSGAMADHKLIRQAHSYLTTDARTQILCPKSLPTTHLMLAVRNRVG